MLSVQFSKLSALLEPWVFTPITSILSIGGSPGILVLSGFNFGYNMSLVNVTLGETRLTDCTFGLTSHTGINCSCPNNWQKSSTLQLFLEVDGQSTPPLYP